jgi:hypothetical protein
MEKVTAHIGQLASVLNGFLDAQMRELDKSMAEVNVLSEMVAISYETVGRTAVDDMAVAPPYKLRPKAQRCGACLSRRPTVSTH